MDNQEAVERLQRLDFELSNARDRLAIHHAITILEWVEKIIERLTSDGPPMPEQEVLEMLRGGEEW